MNVEIGELEAWEMSVEQIRFVLQSATLMSRNKSQSQRLLKSQLSSSLNIPDIQQNVTLLPFKQNRSQQSEAQWNFIFIERAQIAFCLPFDVIKFFASGKVEANRLLLTPPQTCSVLFFPLALQLESDEHEKVLFKSDRARKRWKIPSLLVCKHVPEFSVTKKMLNRAKVVDLKAFPPARLACCCEEGKLIKLAKNQTINHELISVNFIFPRLIQYTNV